MAEDKDEVLVLVDNLTRLQKAYADTCSHCALCADACPVYLESGKKFQLIPGEKLSYLHELIDAQKSLLRRLLGPKLIDAKELEEKGKDLYYCTLCGRCTTFCAFGMDLRSIWPAFRKIIYDAGFTPKAIKSHEERLTDKKDPYGIGSDIRQSWITSLGLDDIPINKEANVVYFVGCNSCVPNPESQNEKIPYGISRILNLVDEDWTILGEEEYCCGSPAAMINVEDTAKELAQHNVEKIYSLGAKTLVTGCACCYRAFKWEYPLLLNEVPRFKVLHIVELISQYLKEGKLKFNQSDLRLTYHDPCELARLGGIIDEPRDILRAITTNFVELPDNKLETICCGGGGLLNIFDPDMANRIASNRIKQAESLDADILVSACPVCKTTLKRAAESLGSKLEVVDIVELTVKQLGLK
ncbi:MAG: (Fe-S)-binding protein [Promethearchaeota archaeon]